MILISIRFVSYQREYLLCCPSSSPGGVPRTGTRSCPLLRTLDPPKGQMAAWQSNQSQWFYLFPGALKLGDPHCGRRSRPVPSLATPLWRRQRSLRFSSPLSLSGDILDSRSGWVSSSVLVSVHHIIFYIGCFIAVPIDFS